MNDAFVGDVGALPRSVDLRDLRSELAKDARLAEALGIVWDGSAWLDRVIEIVADFPVDDTAQRLEDLETLVRDADDVHRRRGEQRGLCDAIDNDGRAYQSAWAARVIANAPHPNPNSAVPSPESKKS